MATLALDGPAIAGAPPAPRRLGLGALTAVVIGSMIGSGVFSLPQNMAAGAGPQAILIGWSITGVGILAFALVYQGLAMRHPSLDGLLAAILAIAAMVAGFLLWTGASPPPDRSRFAIPRPGNPAHPHAPLSKDASCPSISAAAAC